MARPIQAPQTAFNTQASGPGGTDFDISSNDLPEGTQNVITQLNPKI